MIFSQDNISSIIIEGKEYNIQSIPFIGNKDDWDTKSDYIPKAGELVIYTPDKDNDNYRIKIGDGTTKITELVLNYIETAAEREGLINLIEINTNKIQDNAEIVDNLIVNFQNITEEISEIKQEYIKEVQKAEGSIISVDDSGDLPLRDLTLYGKTTQNGTPTPEAPVELVTAGSSGAINVSVCGKNLSDPQEYVKTKTKSTLTKNEDGSYTLASTEAESYVGVKLGTFVMKAGVPYTISFDLISHTNGLGSSLMCGFRRTSDSGFISASYAKNPSRVSVTRTVDVDTKVYGCICCTQSTADTGEVTFKDVQIEVGDIATVYEHYKEAQTLTVSTPNGLPGIPVSSGGNYTDENGQQWLCDEIDFAKGKYIQRICTITPQKVISSFLSTSTGLRIGRVTEKNSTITPVNNDTIGAVLCDSLPVISANNQWKSQQSTIAVSVSDGCVMVCFEDVTTADDLNAILAEKNITVLYAIATPIETALSAEELAAYAALHTNKLNTTVYNDASADMTIEYHIPNSAVPMTYGAANSGSVLGVDEHGCVVPKNLRTNDVNGLKDNLDQKADITQYVSGEVISVENAAHVPLNGLKLYGKTTQAGTPTTEAPVELVTVGSSGSISTTIKGKNLLQDTRTSKADEVSNGVTFVTNADGTITVNGTNNSSTERSILKFTITDKWLFLPAGTYTAYAGFPDHDTGYLQLSFGDKNGSSNDTVVHAYETPKTFTINKPQWAWVALCVKAGATVDNLVLKPQIEAGAIATEYEPYMTPQVLTVSTPNGLPGIPVSSGGNYTDANGQQWICDEIDFGRGVYVQRIKTMVFDGDESLGSEIVTVSGKTYFRLRYKVNDHDPAYRWDVRSDYFKTLNNKVDYGSVSITSSSYLSLYLSESMQNYDVTQGNAWLAENPVTVQYILATPIETAMSAEEMKVYANLHTNKPNTTVYTDSSAYIEMNYYTPSTAVQMVHSPADEGKVLSIDQHGCVVLTDLATQIARIESQLAYMAIMTGNEEMLEV